MKILVIGSGGREHALCWQISKSKKVKEIYCAPGNGGTAQVGQNIDIEVDDIEGLIQFVKKEDIDLTVVGPELPLVMGIVDRFQEEGLKIFGVNKECAQLEASKDFSKKFMEKYNIPTARYETFTELNQALEGIGSFNYPLVIKADGLCAGKGVIICENQREANEALKDILANKCFGSQGDKVVVEEFLDGVETSLLCVITKDKIIPMESAKDFKKIFEGDKGPNTGGVGCYSPSPYYTEDIKEKLENEILTKIRSGLDKENLDFRGILFIGLMIVDGDPKVLEFNVRFGDPETEVLMPRFKSDIVSMFEKTIDASLKEKDLEWDKNHCITVVLTSGGYPSNYDKGFEISGVDKLDQDIILFHNGSKIENDKLVTNGGRVLSITSLGSSIEDTRKSIYANISKLKFNGVYYRKDI